MIYAVCVGKMTQLLESIFLQTRGTSFGKYMDERTAGGKPTYEIDIVAEDGVVQTDEIPVAGYGTLGTADGKAAFMALVNLACFFHLHCAYPVLFPLPQAATIPGIRIIGCGVTEAGICHNGDSMQNIAEFLFNIYKAQGGGQRANKISILNTDNISGNGDLISKFVRECDFSANLGEADSVGFKGWLDSTVVFHNSMVDRIVGQREGNGNVPRTEPMLKKQIVAEDLAGALPAEFGMCK